MAVPPQSSHEIDSVITRVQDFLSASPRSHPARPVCIYFLAKARFDRYELLKQEVDLDKAILHLSESLLLQPWSWPESDIFLIFFNLAAALCLRANKFKRREDAFHAARYLRHLRDHSHEMFSFPLTRHRVTTLLVTSLAFQVELKSGNEMQNIEEMAVLCRELLTSDTSDGSNTVTRSITHFAAAVLRSEFDPNVPDQPLDPVIECLRLAKMRKPELQNAHLAFVCCLCIRFLMTFVDDDYEEAASALDEIITSRSPGDSQNELTLAVQQVVTQMAVSRSTAYENLEYSEEALYRARAFLSSFPDEHPLNPIINHYLEDTAKRRLRYFGSIDGHEAPSDDSLFTQPAVSIDDPELDRIYQNLGLLRGLRSGMPKNDTTKIEEDIEKGRTILASTSSNHPYMSHLFEYFGSVLFEAFQRTHKLGYLDEPIRSFRQVLEVHPFPQHLRFRVISRLCRSLLRRAGSFPGRRPQDLEEGLELLSQCVNDEQGSLLVRLQFACEWAIVARRTQHPSVPSAYESAVSLMQAALLFAPTVQLQHAALAKSHDYHRMPLDYASYQVDQHRLEEAIVTLERGRALLWSEMRHLRASIDQLLQAHPQLGNEYTAINRELEELIKSIPPSHRLNLDDDAADDLREADPFGRLLLRQRRLLKERNKLISQILDLPGFDNFMTSPSFDTIRAAASSGPIIMINHSKWRSDILILLHNTSPFLIPTPDDFYDHANALKEKLSAARYKYGLDSNDYDETLAAVLADLYNLVGKPVIDRLRQLQVPEQSRIWWCPTSVFCALPLHAMGPIPSDDDEKRYFLDLYICSYTPTLSALLQSRGLNCGSRSSERPSLLLVAQPDPSLPTVGGEIQVIQALDIEVISLFSEAATPAAVIDGFRHHQFVHFACHGTLEAGKPFEAGFVLYGEKRLTLLEIVRSHLPTAEFAFLAACHTAEMAEGSIVDEGLHLAAAVQYCGFRSVVGTMWAMADLDGEDLARHFYKSMFRRRGKGKRVLYHERSAEALRDAVKKLRRRRGITLERWVNFVHYGA
ncbi:CHAT domain-containing protein [Lactarius quietus]|nr:CHAT domain-containing protein [Lactarius quietus]